MPWWMFCEDEIHGHVLLLHVSSCLLSRTSDLILIIFRNQENPNMQSDSAKVFASFKLFSHLFVAFSQHSKDVYLSIH